MAGKTSDTTTKKLIMITKLKIIKLTSTSTPEFNITGMVERTTYRNNEIR